MKSQKKKNLPVRAKRYQKRLANNLAYDNLEPRQLLAADLGPTINFVGDTDLINFRNPVAVTEGVDLLRSHLQLGDNESVQLQKNWSDQLGFEHFKYQQFFDGIRVQGSNYTLHVKDSQVVSMSGDRVELVNPVVGAQISSEVALKYASAHIGATQYAWQDAFHSELLGLDGAPEGELVYITGDGGESVPAFKFDMYAIDLGTRDYVYVNANTGNIEATESRIRHGDVDATGESQYNGIVPFLADQVSDMEFRLRQVTDGVETYDNQTNPSNDFSNAIDIIASSPLFDAPVQFSGVSAHWGAENVLSMYQDWFGRDSYDDEGATLISYVNVNQDWINATWNGSVMQYGEGNENAGFGPLVEIDIVGHEITHGVVEFSADLVYAYEPGALNESFADIFGEVVDYYATGSNDWLAGDQVDLNGNGIRNFMDPNEDDQPDTYLGDLWWTNPGDFGGVHFNSGVQNHWFYILSEGLAGTNDNNEDFDVTGIGIEDAAQIAYRNLTTYLGVNSQYQDARDGAVQAAIDIFGKNSEEHKATHEAWEAVGVYPLDIVFEDLVEVVPGSMMFTADATGFVPDFGVRGATIELDPNQTLSVVVNGQNGVAPRMELYGPDETVIASAGANGFQTTFEAIPTVEAGEYRIEIDSANGIVGDFDIQILLNGVFEAEGVQSFDNGDLANAQNIENSVVSLDAISADRLGAIGEFNIAEIPALVGDDFESGMLDGNWSATSTDTSGRIRVLDHFNAGEGDFALYMDTAASGVSNLNEAIWTVDLSSVETPYLNFFYASFNDENTILPDSFNGTTIGDGVSVSDDGVTWHTILTDSVTESGDWKQFSLRLDNFADVVGIDLTSTFQVKFQQYDDDVLGSDGRAFDGIAVTNNAMSEDWYSFDLTAGEVSTIAVGQTELTGFVEVELYDSSGALLMAGTPGGDIANRISQFVASETDTYFARLAGSATPYGLVVTRGTDFDTGSSVSSPQDLSVPNSVMGYVDTVGEAVAEPDAAEDRTVLDNFYEGVTLSNNITGGSVYAVRASFEAPTGDNVFGPTVTGASGWQEGVNELRADFDIPQRYVSIRVGAEETAGDMGYLRAFDVEGVEIDNAFSRPLDASETQTIWVTSPTREIAYILAGGFQNDITPLDDLRFEVHIDSNDYYSVTAEPNQVISVNATFPGAGPLLFENSLTYQFQMELVDANGQVVANGVNSMNYYAAFGGEFVIRATAIAGRGDYQLGITTETQDGGNQTYFSLGSVGLGVAVDDSAVGRGYLMYSTEALASRFASNPPADGNAEHVIAVRYYQGQWEYNDNSNWHAFTAAEGDRLIALVNFRTDRIDSLEGLAGLVHGIEQGFVSSDIKFNSNVWNSMSDNGEFEITGTHFYVGNQNISPTTVGDVGLGIGVHDVATGQGYIMFSEPNLYERFAGDPPRPEGAQHMIAVRVDPADGQWQYSNNVTWVDFIPNETDRLIANVNFDADTIAGIEGYGGTVNGVHQGFFDSDLVFVANRWDGESDIGEFEVTGTTFHTAGYSFEIGPLQSGIAVDDAATGEGYFMYSETDVHTRFSSNPPAASTMNNVIAVRFEAGNWEYNDDAAWHTFNPMANDRLIAIVSFEFDKVSFLSGTSGHVQGIARGFYDSDLRISIGSFDSLKDPGEFQIFGTSFIV